MKCDFFFFQAEDGIRDYKVTGVQTCALPISPLADGVSVARPAFAWLADAPLRLWQSVYQEKLNVFTWASTEEGSTRTRTATARTTRSGRMAWLLRGRFEKHPKEWQLSCRRSRLASASGHARSRRGAPCGAWRAAG